nr:hypothetical protein [Candidatus Saccharibacteria bacterium]NIW78439.1 hypothetical protein [Calditrichia bacterium]
MKRIGDHKQYNTIRLFTILLTVVSLLIASPLLQADDDIEVEGPIQAIGS